MDADIKFNLPTTKELEEELYRIKYNRRYKKLFRSTIYALIIILAISVVIATLVFPVLQIYENSMSPTLEKDDIVLSVKTKDIKGGDVIAFYYNNHILVKRVIAVSSDWVEFDIEGNVYVNGRYINETYIKDKEVGEYDISFPYQVPENTYFVLNDERSESLDSRSQIIGTVKQEDVVGKIILRLWPMNKIGTLN